MCNIDQKELWKQINIENEILNTRTNFFLLANTLLAVINYKGNDQAKYVCLAIIITDIIWLLSSYQSKKVILKLIKELKELKEDKIYKLIDSQLCNIELLRPTELLSIILPCIFIIAWLLIIINIFSPINIATILILTLIILTLTILILLCNACKCRHKDI